MLHIAVGSSCFGEMSPEEAIGLLAANGCREIELAEEHAAALLDRGSPVKIGTELRNYAAECGITFRLGHLSITGDIAHPDRSERLHTVDHLKRWLDLFAALNIKTAILHPGGVTAAAAGLTEERIAELRGESLRMLSAYARGSGITLALENVSQDAELLLQMVRSIGTDNLAVCLNTVALEATGSSAADFALTCNGMLCAIHAGDTSAEINGAFPKELNSAWTALLDALKKIEYTGAFCLEAPGERRLPQEVRLQQLATARACFA